MRFNQLFLMVAIIAIIGACKDDFSSAGSGILPEGEVISTHISQSNINALNEISPAIKSADPSTFILGEVVDDEFGKSKADFLSQFSIGEIGIGDTSRLKYNEYYLLDSTMLLLKYPKNAWIGDTLANHEIQVYELNASLSQLESYTSDINPSDYADESYLAGSLTFNARNGKNDSIWDQTSYVDTLFIPIFQKEDLSDVGNRIFHEEDSSKILNNDKFRDLFKGFYITSELEGTSNAEGSLIQFNHRSYAQELVLYYKRLDYDVTLGEIIDTTYFQKKFPINNESVKINRFENDHSESSIDFDDNSVDKLYIQPMSGSLAKVLLSEEFKENWRDSIANIESSEHLGIASVDMTFYVDTAATNYRVYTQPSSLSIYRKNSKGEFISPSFINYTGTLSAGIGTGQLVYGQTEEGYAYPSYYIFSFTPSYFEEYVDPSSYNQELVDFEELYIMPQNPESNFNRVILHSSNVIPDPEDESIAEAFLAIKYVKLK